MERISIDMEAKVNSLKSLIHVLDAFVLPELEEGVENKDHKLVLGLLNDTTVLLESALEMIDR